MQFPMKPLPPDPVLHFVLDPLNEAREVPARNLHVLREAVKGLDFSNSTTPTLMIQAADD